MVVCPTWRTCAQIWRYPYAEAHIITQTLNTSVWYHEKPHRKRSAWGGGDIRSLEPEFKVSHPHNLLTMLSLSGFQNPLLWSLVAMKMKIIWQIMFQILVAWLSYLVSHQLVPEHGAEGGKLEREMCLLMRKPSLTSSHFSCSLWATRRSGPTPPASHTWVNLQFIPLWLSYCGCLEEGSWLRHRTVGYARNSGLFYSLKFLQIHPGGIWYL